MTKTEELIYTAGILDGEGCLRTYVVMNGRKEKHRIAIIAVSQNDIRLLDWLQTRFGGNIHALNNSKCFQWQLRNTKAVELIKKTQPYLLVKDEDAKKFLAFICEYCSKSNPTP